MPSVDDPIWRDVVSGRVRPQFEHLGLQIFMGRTRMVTDGAPQEVDRLARELHQFFVANQHHPKVQRDFARIRG